MIGELTALQKERRQKILAAASNHFSRIGFYKAELDQIAREAGVGKGTIYRYFKNKHDLYLSTIEFELANLLSYIEEKTGLVTDPVEYMRILIDAYIDYFQKNKKSFDIIILSTTGLVDDVIRIVNKVQSQFIPKFARKINKGIKAGIFRELKPELILQALHGSLLYLLYDVFKRKKFNMTLVKENLETLFMKGLIREQQSK